MSHDLEQRRYALEIAHSETQHPADVVERAEHYLGFLFPLEDVPINGVGMVKTESLRFDEAERDRSAA
jgi:hypothetical protein